MSSVAVVNNNNNSNNDDDNNNIGDKIIIMHYSLGLSGKAGPT